MAVAIERLVIVGPQLVPQFVNDIVRSCSLDNLGWRSQVLRFSRKPKGGTDRFVDEKVVVRCLPGFLKIFKSRLRAFLGVCRLQPDAQWEN